MKRSGPYNVMRNPNAWENVPRDPATIGAAILGNLGTAGAAIAATKFGSVIVGYVATSLISSWAMSALAPKPDFGAATSGTILSNTVSGIAAHDGVYGKVRKGGIITFYESTGDNNTYLHQIISLAGHEVNSIGDIYINDQVATFSGDFVTVAGTGDDQTTWGSKIRIKKYDGSQTAVDADLVSETSVDANFKGLGVAYLYIRYEYDQDIFASGVPTVTAVVEGKKVYDPRTDATAYSNNAALCIRDFIVSEYGFYDSSVDNVYFAAAANECDENISLSGGGTEKRYELNGVLQADRKIGDILSDMVTACAGSLFWGSGTWRLKVGAYSAPVKTLTLDDLRGPINLDTRASIRSNFNSVIGTFNDADQNWVTADYPKVSSVTSAGDFVSGDVYTITDAGNTNFAAIGASSNTVGVTFTATGSGSGTGKASAFLGQDNGEEASLDLQLPFTTSASAAQRLAKLTLFRGREQMTFSADFGLEAFSVEAGDIVAFTNERYGFSAKEFEVVGWKFASSQDAGDLRVTLTLRETSEAAFDWNAEEVAITSNDTTLPNVASGTNTLGLTLSDGGSEVQGDGTVENSLVASWTASTNAFTSYYEVEWGQTTSVNKTTFTTSDNSVSLAPVVDGVEYTVRVRSVSVTGYRGAYASATSTSGGDTTAPAVPTSVTATGLLGGIDISWTNPADADFSHAEIYESTDSNFANAVSVGRSSGSNFVRGNLSPNVTRYYWVRATDFSGNSSAFVGPQSSTSKLITSDDLGAAIIPYEALDTSLQATITSKADTTDLADYVTQTTYDLSVNAVQELEASAEDLATKALELAVAVSDAESTITDAGIVVDASTGEVTIQAVTSLGDTVNQVQIDLDAAETAIELRATQTYVDNEIAAAVLDSADLASLNNLITRVDDVELTVDGGGTVLGASQMVSGETYTIYAVGTTDFTSFGADSNTVGHTFYASGAGTGTGQVQVAGDTARIALVASGTVFDVTDGKVKVSDITSDITVLQGSVSTKASSSDLTALDGRVTTAESEIAAIDGASITQNLIDTRAVIDEQEQLGTLTLQDVLGRYGDRKYLNADISSVRTSLQADVNDQGVALATAKTELAALIDDNSALISSEQTARADADSAIASDVTSLTSTVSGIQTDLNGVETEVDATSTAVTNLTSRVTNTEGDIASVASDVTSLSTTVGSNTASITSASSSIDGIETKYGVEIDNNGSISGFQLLSGAGSPSAFNVRADQFNLFNSSGVSGGTPFSVFTSSRTIDGVTYPAGTYMDDIYVQNSINVTDQSGNIIFGAGTPLDGTFIAEATIDTAQIKDAAIENAKIGDTIQSTNYAAGSTGWRILKNGSAEFNNVVISRPLVLNSGSFSYTGSVSSGSTLSFDFVNTGIRIGDDDVWANQRVALVAVARAVPNSASSVQSGSLWRAKADVYNSFRWNGSTVWDATDGLQHTWTRDPSTLVTPDWSSGTSQRVLMDIEIKTSLIQMNSPITVYWKVYQVT